MKVLLILTIVLGASPGLDAGDDDSAVGLEGGPAKYPWPKNPTADLYKKIGFIVGRCVDCANNPANWKQKDKKERSQKCIKGGDPLICVHKTLEWGCADTEDKKKLACHRTFSYSSWCNQKEPLLWKCDGKIKYTADGWDGRVLTKDGYWVGPDGRFNKGQGPVFKVEYDSSLSR